MGQEGCLKWGSEKKHNKALQYISGWLFERNRAIGRYLLTIILLSWSY